jgi:hypothetical protein
MKYKLKKYLKNKFELDSFVEYNEPQLFGYYKRHKGSDLQLGSQK